MSTLSFLLYDILAFVRHSTDENECKQQQEPLEKDKWKNTYTERKRERNEWQYGNIVYSKENRK